MLNNAKWRKTTDINREYAIFELIVDDVPILDIGYSDAGILEISFNQYIAGSLIEWETFRSTLAEGKSLADSDKSE